MTREAINEIKLPGETDLELAQRLGRALGVPGCIEIVAAPPEAPEHPTP